MAQGKPIFAKSALQPINFGLKLCYFWFVSQMPYTSLAGLRADGTPI